MNKSLLLFAVFFVCDISFSECAEIRAPEPLNTAGYQHVKLPHNTIGISLGASIHTLVW